MEKDVLAKQIGYLVLQLWETHAVLELMTKPIPPTPTQEDSHVPSD